MKPYSLPFVVAIVNTFLKIWVFVVYVLFLFPPAMPLFLNYRFLGYYHSAFLSTCLHIFIFPKNDPKPIGITGLFCLRTDCNERCAGSDITALCSIPAHGMHVCVDLVWQERSCEIWTPPWESMWKHSNNRGNWCTNRTKDPRLLQSIIWYQYEWHILSYEVQFAQ